MADSGWIKIFEQKAWVYFVLAVFFGSAWFLMDSGHLKQLEESYPWSKDAGLLGALLFSALAIVAACRGLIGWVRAKFALREARKEIVARLNSLSDEEHHILSYLVLNSQRSFNCPLTNPTVALLVQKRLVIRGGGNQNILAVAHFVPNHVWDHLERNKNEFNSVDPNGQAPWIRHWMA